MSMKSKIGMYSVFAAMAMMGSPSWNKSQSEETAETEEERERRLKKAELERNKTNGLKEFKYGENSVWAINQKNADKKARKNNWL